MKTVFNNKKAFVAYVTAGHGGLEYTRDACLALVEGGVDILEIGVPFSDPVADGPVIQMAMEDALNRGTNLFQVLQLIKELKAQIQIPIVLFSYYNPLLKLKDELYGLMKEAGVDSLLTVDLPMEEAQEHYARCNAANIGTIPVVSPTTNDERLKLLAEKADGFIYYACRNGITGLRAGLPEDFTVKINHIKQKTAMPVVVGFGISTADHAAQVLQSADGFVVGSRFVKAMSEGATRDELKQLAQAMDPRGVK